MTKCIDGGISVLRDMIKSVLEDYELAILMEGNVPILKFDRCLSDSQIDIVLKHYTRKGSTYWIDGIDNE